MSQVSDRIFFRNYSIVIGLLAVMIIIFLILARSIAATDETHNPERAKGVAQRTEPVGQVNVEGQAPKAAPAAGTEQVAAAGTASGGAAGGKTETHEEMGKRVFSGLCFSCHGTGIPGVPQFGNKEEWAPHIAKGLPTLYQHAMHGFTGKSGMMMPPRGGNPNLTDEEVKAAVDYMTSHSK